MTEMMRESKGREEGFSSEIFQLWNPFHFWPLALYVSACTLEIRQRKFPVTNL